MVTRPCVDLTMSVPVLKSMKHPVPAEMSRGVSYDSLLRQAQCHSEVARANVRDRHEASASPLTVRLLRIALGQALVPDQRRLLISDQPSNRDPLQRVALFEVPIHFRVGHDPRQRLPRHVEKLAQLVAPVLLVQVVEQGAARVRGVGDVQAAVFAARQLLRGKRQKKVHGDQSSAPSPD